ncbi:MAG: outer membrane beta-barrel protein [Flavobacteriaceae bacterium]|nr:outer membrane beta-barrel protein [Flavobacteriaceae bacterium]
MKHKKNIDTLFKDQLGSFEATPSPEVWDAIEAKLKKEKEDRKVIPIWWKLGGVAAVLLLLLSLSGIFNNSTTMENNPIVKESVEKTDTENSIQKEEATPILSNKNTDALVSEDINSEINTVNTIEENPSEKFKNTSENAVSSTNKIDNNISEKNSKKNIKYSTVKDAVVVSKDPKTINNTNAQKLNEAVINNNYNVKKDGVTSTEPQEKTEKDTRIDHPNTKKETNTIIPNQIEDAVAKEEIVKKEDKDLPSENKKSIFDAIEENKEAVAKKEEKNSSSYWEVSPNVGPVYYNSINGGSSISPSFADNSQTGETNISYGVQVSYAFNDKLSVRTGINNVNVGYTTGDVTIASAPNELALKSINYNNNGGKNVLTVFDKDALQNLSTDPSNPYSQITQKSSSGNAEITQHISYFEVPVELKYALLNKRFGIHMIGGFSTLFLGNNEISVSDGDIKSVLGEANNLNTTSFSTNIGLGFDYKISKRFKFNIEPIFKYQLNPYTTSVDFNPYYFGVYSGVSFKF